MSNHWTFLSNHGRVFEYIATHEHCTGDTMSQDIGITQRLVYMILKDLEKEGYITRIKIGRCNRYEIHTDLPMRHRLDRSRRVREILPGWSSGTQHLIVVN